MEHEPGRRLTGLATFVVRRAAWVLVAWLAVVAAVNVAVPQLEAVVAEDSTPVVPEHAPAIETLSRMDSTFGNGRSASFVFVALEREGGLAPRDHRYVDRLTARLLRDDERVSFVQDVRRSPQLREALVSKDGEAMYLQVGLPGHTGAPSALDQIQHVRDVAHERAPDGLEVAVTGPAATIADMSTEVEHSILTITFVTVGLIALILLLLYRSVAVTAVALGFIGIALAGARGFTALLGSEVFAVSTFTGSFLTAVVLGAGTDYAVFMISRYQELRRDGLDPVTAATTGAAKVAAVIIGSAMTVILANASMALADVGIFRTTGPAIAVSVLVTLVLSLTVLPAMIALVGVRGWLDPRPSGGRAERGGWTRLGSLLVTHPGRVLAAGLLPLLVLSLFYPFMKPSFDERSVQPDDTESNRGYALMGEHFPLNEVLPDYVLVTAERDMRNPRDLAALEQAAASIARVDGVESVRGVTRPTGTTISEASLGHQAGVVGRRLGGARDDLAAGESGARELATGAGRLSSGARKVASGADRVTDGAQRAAAGAGRVLTGARELHDGVERLATGSDEAASGSRRLRAAADRLADGLEAGQAQAQVAVDGLGLAHDGLQRSIACGLDPICRRARDGVRQVYEGERDQLLPGMREAATAARQIADGTVELDDGLARLSSGLDRAEAGAERLAAGSSRLSSGLGELEDGAGQVAQGADRLAAGASRVEGGTEEMALSVRDLRSGLTRAADYLQATGAAASDPAVGGFHLPPAAMQDERFALASGLFLSPDGRTARMVVLGGTDSFGRTATERAGAVREAAGVALRGTPLEGSTVETTGVATINSDLEDLSDADFGLVALVALVAVFLILLLLLRSVVAAAFLLASVALSYAAAMGLGVLVWQIGLDQPLDWSVPTIAFILLVAVGADYNLLLMKRMLEESPDGSRAGIARAVSATGRVITAAGVIFAASMFAMMAGSAVTLMQIGFTIGMGLLLDTFVVRTLVVPAVAALLGQRLWWPRTSTES